MRDPSLQFSFDAAAKPPPPTHLPHWLEAVLRAIGNFLVWIGQGLGWVFVAGLVAALLIVLAFIAREIIRANWPDLLKKKPGKPKPAIADWRPEAARHTFSAIAGVVERSFFGGRDVDAAGFAECRRTYEAFAFPGAWA